MNLVTIWPVSQIIWLVGTLAIAPAAAPNAKLHWLAACPVQAPPGTRCRELEVPERRAVASSRTITVPFAVLEQRLSPS